MIKLLIFIRNSISHITPRITGRKRNADFEKVTLNDDYAKTKVPRLLRSFVNALVMPNYFLDSPPEPSVMITDGDSSLCV